MIYGSVCSGIEAATVAWAPLGWRPAWFAEIDKFPSAVLAHHYPEVPNVGDFTKIGPDRAKPIDLLVGGTPCQDFSIAGLRAGLAGARGNLSLEFLRLLDRIRPRWVVWENVPGTLSSNRGKDFGALLWRLVELRYGVAFRILDAQYVRVDGFGRAVPQRRRRLFVVGYLGDWRRAAAVLFERESLRGNSAPRHEAGKDVADDFGGHSFKNSDADGLNALAFGGNNTSGPIDVSCALNAHGGSSRIDFESETFVAFDCKASGRNGFAAGDVAPTLRSMGHKDSHQNAGGQVAVATRWAVRRLTPVECERLQGFPDNYTNIPWRNRTCAPDGPRYKALGNSMAVNCMRWIGRRIGAVCRFVDMPECEGVSS